MCGIVAVFSAAGQVGLHGLARRATDIVQHRGPDDSSVAFGLADAEIADDARPLQWALGHSRLSILDLSENGRQPMTTKDRQRWISFNGEIYNYLEIRDELTESGFEFRTETDTEVLLAAYLHWGEACVAKFIGMFAFVIVDLHRQCCFIARDYVGIKPLFVWQHGKQTVVVSEPKQLLVFPEYRPIMNSQLAVDYLNDGLLDHEPDACLFAGVRRLPAGQTLSWSLNETPNWAERKPFWGAGADSGGL